MPDVLPFSVVLHKLLGQHFFSSSQSSDAHRPPLGGLAALIYHKQREVLDKTQRPLAPSDTVHSAYSGSPFLRP